MHRDRRPAPQICKSLSEAIRPHMFKIPVQAASGRTIIAREDIPPLPSRTCSPSLRGPRHRKQKVLRQKEGKKRMKEFGSVNVPQAAFIAVLKGTVGEG